MESIIFTQLTRQELRSMIREEMKSVMKDWAPPVQTQKGNVYMNIEETAKLIGLAVASVYNLVYRKQIPHIKRGKFLKFERDKIIAWIEAGRKKTKEEIVAETQMYIPKARL